MLKEKLATKIPPPIYGLLTALLMWWLSQIFPAFTVIPPMLSKLGFLLIASGFAIDLIALMQFRKSDTTINPLSPNKASNIVISGLYKISRNPMYVGMLIVLSGWGLYLGNLASFIGLPLFVWVITQVQILPEEKILTEKFGKPYTDYLKKVRRWL